MKRIITLALGLCFFLLTSSAENRAEVSRPQRGLLVSLIQDVPVLSSREEITKLIDFSKKTKVQILFVQIYRSGQAWFPSRIADAAPYADALQNVREDPFALLIRQAHEAGLEVHAWLNVLSLSVNENAPILRRYGKDILTRDRKDKTGLSDYEIDGQYFLEPGDLRVRYDLSGMVREIVETYPELDGIQFDYIRYPDTHPVYGYAPENLERFRGQTGLSEVAEENPVWQDWKRKQVTELLGMLVKEARAARPEIRISATGCMPYARAYHEAFQDWLSWLDQGIVDFVTAMNYSAIPEEYSRRNRVVRQKTSKFQNVFFSVGAYKSESTQHVFAEELSDCEKSGAGGCVLFHYGSLTDNLTLKSFLSKSLPGSFLPAPHTIPLASVSVKPILSEPSGVSNQNSDVKPS